MDTTSRPPTLKITDPISEYPPRAARFTPQAQATRIFIATLAAATLFLMCWLGLRDMNDLKALQSNGRMMGALITEKSVRYGKQNTYLLRYNFYVNQTTVENQQAVPVDVWENAVVGATIPVTYLPSNPNIHRVGAVTEDRIARQGRLWFFGSLAVLMIVGIGGGAVEWSFQEQLTLMQGGVAVAGTILGREVTHTTDYHHRNKSTHSYISYTIPIGPPGRIYKLETSWSIMYDIDITAPITILCDPARPWRNRPLATMTAVRAPR